MIKNQKGFALVETALVLVIVALIGFVGWYVLQSSHKTTNLLAETDKVSSAAPELKTSAKTQKTQSAPTTTTNTTATPQPTTSKSTPKKISPAPSAPAVIHPSNDDITRAEFQAGAIQGVLEAYYATYGYYVDNLTPDPLINQPGVSGVTASTFVAPAGTKFVYSCTKGAPIDGADRCLGYYLQVQKSDGTVIETLKNLF